MGEYAATVIICTHNRADSLAVTLESLARDGSSTAAEVIVVNNGSSDHTSQVIENAPRGGRSFHHLELSQAGHNVALNAAVDVARGNIFLFTDDDVTIRPGWVDAIVDAFDEDVGAVGGRIIPVLEGDRPEWMGEDFVDKFPGITLRDRGDAPFDFKGPHYPTGANMAIRADLVGSHRFDTRFGPQRGVSLSYGEAELLRRIRDGRRYVYVPTAVLEHRVNLDRLDFPNVRRRVFQTGMGAARFRNDITPCASYPRRAVRAGRSYLSAGRARRQNARRQLTPDAAVAELSTFYTAGADLETLLVRAPRLSTWLSTVLT